MALIVGELRHSIKIMQRTVTKGQFNEDIESYALLTTLRAGLKYTAGTKAINNDETFSSQTLQFTTHYRPTVTESMRIEFKSKKYRILSIAEIGFKEGLLINAELINE